MSVFKHPAVLENGTYRFDVGGGRFIRATPKPGHDDQFHVRGVDGGKAIMTGEMDSQAIDAIVEGWMFLADSYDSLDNEL